MIPNKNKTVADFCESRGYGVIYGYRQSGITEALLRCAVAAATVERREHVLLVVETQDEGANVSELVLDTIATMRPDVFLRRRDRTETANRIEIRQAADITNCPREMFYAAFILCGAWVPNINGVVTALGTPPPKGAEVFDARTKLIPYAKNIYVEMTGPLRSNTYNLIDEARAHGALLFLDWRDDPDLPAGFEDYATDVLFMGDNGMFKRMYPSHPDDPGSKA